MARDGGDAEPSLCEFSPDGGAFALATADGLLKTFDTVSGRLVLTKSASNAAGGVGHLQEPATAVAWAQLPSQQVEGREQSMLVAGSAAGSVQAFDASTGDQLWRLQGAHDGPVESLALVGGHLLSCGADGKLRAIHPRSGRLAHTLAGEAAGQARRMWAATGGENLLLAGSELFLCSADLQRRIRWFTGHPMPASVLAVDSAGGWAVSGCPGERHLAVWELKNKRKKAQLPAAAALPMEHPPVHAAVCPPDASGSFFVAAVEAAGAAYVWQCSRSDAGGALQTELRSKLSLPGRAASARSDGLLAVWLQATAAGASLLLARGSAARPVFERVAVAAEGSQEAQLAPLDEGLLLPGKRSKAERKAAKQAAVVSPELLLPNGHSHQQGSPSGERLAGQKRGAEAEPEEAAADAAAGPEPMDAADGLQEGSEDEEGEGDGELTLGQRVQALQLRQQQGAEASTAEPLQLDASSSAARAGSLAVLLSQALRAEDNALIERCLAAGSDSVVARTVAGLSAADAGLLLAAVVRRLRARASRGQQLAGWIRAVLLRHTAALMGDLGQQQVLSSLYQTIEARLQQQRPLTQLLGRLDLLLAQAPDPAEAADSRPGPVVHVIGQDDAEVEVEDPFAAAAESSSEGDDGSESSDGEEPESDSEDE